MDSKKALDIDEISSLFYKENWDVLRLCDDMLNGNKGVRDINETIIVLIPKVLDPKDIT